MATDFGRKCRNEICNEKEYCDEVLQFCRPCDSLCDSDGYDLEKCKLWCFRGTTTESPQALPADASSNGTKYTLAISLSVVITVFLIVAIILSVAAYRQNLSSCLTKRNRKQESEEFMADNRDPAHQGLSVKERYKGIQESRSPRTSSSGLEIHVTTESVPRARSPPPPDQRGSASEHQHSLGAVKEIKAEINKPWQQQHMAGYSWASSGHQGASSNPPSFPDFLYVSEHLPSFPDETSNSGSLNVGAQETEPGNRATAPLSQCGSVIAQPENEEQRNQPTVQLSQQGSVLAQPENEDPHRSIVYRDEDMTKNPLRVIQAFIPPGGLDGGVGARREEHRPLPPQSPPQRSRSRSQEREPLLGAVGGEEPRTEIHPHAPIGDEIREKSLSDLTISFGNERINELNDDYRNFVRRLPGFQRVLLHRDGVIIVHATPEEYRNAAERLMASVWATFRHRVLPDPEMQDIETGQLHLCVGGDRATYRHLPGSHGQTVDHFHLSDDMPTLPPEVPAAEPHHQMTVLPSDLHRIPGVTVRTQAPPGLASSSFDWSSSGSALPLPALGYQAQFAMMFHTSDEDDDSFFPHYNAAGYEPAPAATRNDLASGSNSSEPAMDAAGYAPDPVVRRNNSKTVSRSDSVSGASTFGEVYANGFNSENGVSSYRTDHFDSTLPSRSMQRCPLSEEHPGAGSNMALLAGDLSHLKAEVSRPESDGSSGYCTAGYCTESTLVTCENQTTITELSSPSFMRSTGRNSVNV